MTHSFPPRRPSDLQPAEHAGRRAASKMPRHWLGGWPHAAKIAFQHCGHGFCAGRYPELQPRVVMERPVGDEIGVPGIRIGMGDGGDRVRRSEEHTSDLPSLMRISYAVFCLK